MSAHVHSPVETTDDHGNRVVYCAICSEELNRSPKSDFHFGGSVPEKGKPLTVKMRILIGLGFLSIALILGLTGYYLFPGYWSYGLFFWAIVLVGYVLMFWSMEDEDGQIHSTAHRIPGRGTERSINMESKEINKPENPSIHVEGNVSNSTFVVGSKNIVITILEGVDQNALNRDRSISYKEMGRTKVQEWGDRLVHDGEWDWHLLGHAIEYYLDSIKFDPAHQHPWTNLAYVYHLIGESQKARECLKKSFDLASPGPNRPGNNYKQVKTAMDRGAYLTGGQVERPHMPDWFRDKYQRYLS